MLEEKKKKRKEKNKNKKKMEEIITMSKKMLRVKVNKQDLYNCKVVWIII